MYFPNSTQVTDTWIVAAKELLDSVIICDEIPITDMPPILQSDLDNEKNELVIKTLKDLKYHMVKSAFVEMGNTLPLHSIPPKEEFLKEIDKYSSLHWDAGDSFSRSLGQTDESFEEQSQAVMNFTQAIDDYIDPLKQGVFLKSRVIAGSPGSGKSYLMNYSILYAISKGLNVCVTAVMSKRANVLGGIHIHKLFKLPCKNGLNVHRMAELAVTDMLRAPEKIQVLRTLNILFIDEIGQLS